MDVSSGTIGRRRSRAKEILKMAFRHSPVRSLEVGQFLGAGADAISLPLGTSSVCERIAVSLRNAAGDTSRYYSQAASYETLNPPIGF